MAVMAHEIEPELRADPPRPFRLKKSAYRYDLTMPIILFGVFALVGGGIWVLSLFETDTREEFAEHGVVTQATVKRVSSRRVRGGGLRVRADYEYTVQGTTYRNTQDVLPLTRSGEQIEITYLANDPGTSRAGDLTHVNEKHESERVWSGPKIVGAVALFLAAVILPFYLWQLARARAELAVARTYQTAVASIESVVAGGPARYTFQTPEGATIRGKTRAGLEFTPNDTVTVLYHAPRPRHCRLYGELKWVEPTS